MPLLFVHDNVGQLTDYQRRSRTIARKPNLVLIFVVILGIGVALTYAMHKVLVELEGSWILGGATVLAYAVSSAILVADQRSTTVVLRPSKFRSLQGSGLFLIIPLIDTIPLLDRHPPPHEQPNERNSELKKETPIDI